MLSGWFIIIRIFLNPNPKQSEYAVKTPKENRSPNQDWYCKENKRITASRKVVVNIHNIPVQKPTSKANRGNN